MADPQPHFIRAWREHAGLTQAQLAARIGMSRPYLSRIERGARRYDQPFLELAATALGCTPADLIGRDPADPGGIDALWAALGPGQRLQALAVLRALFPA